MSGSIGNKLDSVICQSVDYCYAKLGWSFTPLAMGGPAAGKRPMLTGWQSAERETQFQAVQWAAAGNVGLRTGKASGGLVVVDLDVAKPEYDAEAVKALNMPATVTVQTGSGGWHLYFQLPAESGVSLGNSANKLAPAVDVRADGGQVVFAGSLHIASGKRYAWREGFEPWNIEVAELPQNLLEMLTTGSKSQAGDSLPSSNASAVSSAENPSGAAAPAAPGHDNNSRGSDAVDGIEKYGQKALVSEIAKVSTLGDGGRNQGLNESAYKIGGLVAAGAIAEHAAAAGLLAAAMTCGLPRSEAEKTIRSGLEAGKKEPRKIPEPRYPVRASGKTSRPPAPPALTNNDDSPRYRDTSDYSGGAEGGDAWDFAGNFDDSGDSDLMGLGGMGQRRDIDGLLVLEPSRTLPTARAFVREFYAHNEGRKLYSYAGQLHEWRDNHFATIEADALKNTMQPWLHDAWHVQYSAKEKDNVLRPFPANPGTINAAIDTLKADSHLPLSKDAPFWVSPDGIARKYPATELLCCKGQNLHVPTGEILEPTPNLFCQNALEFDYDAEAPPPESWLDFLDSIWPDDEAAKALLQEWFGYCLVADTSQQKMLLIVGPPRSGKGTIGRVLTQLIGESSVAGPTADSLAEQFGLAQLIGKSVAIVSDARFNGRQAELQTLVERLLCITGEDRLTIRRLYEKHFEIKLPTRMVFFSNEVPRLKDAAGALASRFLILQLEKSFYDKEDLGLTNRLLGELPGILLWALQGLRRLKERGRFVMPESSQPAVDMLADLGSPIGAFVRQKCEYAEDGQEFRVSPADLYEAYKQWCDEGGQKYTATIQGFGRELSAVVAGRAKIRRNSGGRFYEGLRLKVNEEVAE